MKKTVGISLSVENGIFFFKIVYTPGPLLVRENGRLRSPHYWKSALLESYYRNIAKTHYWESYIMYYGRNVYFLNPHYREIRTMGGRTNRGPGVLTLIIWSDGPINLGMYIYVFINLHNEITPKYNKMIKSNHITYILFVYIESFSTWSLRYFENCLLT